ncbi:MAG TPA: hypothetical protein VN843_01880, partial [Anaerolineales bacterium]|nr:hypothetical protein [Anaerolineales bacterium]
LRETSVTSLGGDSFRVRLVIQNEGWLPTYVTKKALERKVTRGVIAEIQLPKGASLESGKGREELGELNGRSYKNAFIDEMSEGTEDRVKAEWVVKAKKGSKVKLIAKHDRAGVVKVDVVLK